VDGKKELYELCQTSKLIRSIAEPLLYRLHFCNSELAQRNDIRVLVQHPTFETIVNTIYIDLPRWKYCSSWDRKPRYFKLPFRNYCSCDELDETLGRSLASLTGLKILRVSCSLCPVQGQYERHVYLRTLKTRSLHTIMFTCSCHGATPDKESNKKMMETFTAPCLASVTSLMWSREQTSWTTNEESEPRMNTNMLPNLQHLHHGGEELHNLLLRHCPITRLSATLLSATSTRLNYNSLKTSRDRLTHISINLFFNASRRFFKAVVHDAESFRNLRHIGTFVLKTATCLVSCIISRNVTESKVLKGAIQ
jgi:hypothetical protein